MGDRLYVEKWVEIGLRPLHVRTYCRAIIIRIIYEEDTTPAWPGHVCLFVRNYILARILEYGK